MGTVSTSLQKQAASIFADLGYEVSNDGGDLRAQRKWRTVHVTPTVDPHSLPDSGEFRCFVTFADRIDALEQALSGRQPDYEWAIIGVADDDYEVACRSTSS